MALLRRGVRAIPAATGTFRRLTRDALVDETLNAFEDAVKEI